MKKQVKRLLRLAARDGDLNARDLLKFIKDHDMEKLYVMQCEGYCHQYTYFRWGPIKVHYNGKNEEINVFYGSVKWTLAD